MDQELLAAAIGLHFQRGRQRLARGVVGRQPGVARAAEPSGRVKVEPVPGRVHRTGQIAAQGQFHRQRAASLGPRQRGDAKTLLQSARAVDIPLVDRRIVAVHPVAVGRDLSGPHRLYGAAIAQPHERHVPGVRPDGNVQGPRLQLGGEAVGRVGQAHACRGGSRMVCGLVLPDCRRDGARRAMGRSAGFAVGPRWRSGLLRGRPTATSARRAIRKPTGGYTGETPSVPCRGLLERRSARLPHFGEGINQPIAQLYRRKKMISSEISNEQRRAPGVVDAELASLGPTEKLGSASVRVACENSQLPHFQTRDDRCQLAATDIFSNFFQ